MSLSLHHALADARHLVEEDRRRIEAAWHDLVQSGTDRKMQYLEDEFIRPLGGEMTRFGREMTELQHTLSSNNREYLSQHREARQE